MINIKDLKESDIGRIVIYDSGYFEKEEGRLSSWNDTYIFIKFKGPNGEACNPEDVSFIF